MQNDAVNRKLWKSRKMKMLVQVSRLCTHLSKIFCTKGTHANGPNKIQTQNTLISTYLPIWHIFHEPWQKGRTKQTCWKLGVLCFHFIRFVYAEHFAQVSNFTVWHEIWKSRMKNNEDKYKLLEIWLLCHPFLLIICQFFQ